MKLSQPTLWFAIEQQIIAGEQHTLFCQKLNTQFDWSPAFIVSALAEYKRFLYLVAINDETIVPSKMVDEVWHLHLTFTRDYWQVWATLLGKEIHHSPSEHSDTQTFKHSNKLYEREFGHQPAQQCAKPASKWKSHASIAAISVLALTSYAMADNNSDNLSDANWLFWGAGLVIFSLILRALWPSKKGKGGRGGSGGSGGGSSCSSDCSSSSCGSSCGGD